MKWRVRRFDSLSAAVTAHSTDTDLPVRSALLAAPSCFFERWILSVAFLPARNVFLTVRVLVAFLPSIFSRPPARSVQRSLGQRTVSFEPAVAEPDLLRPGQLQRRRHAFNDLVGLAARLRRRAELVARGHAHRQPYAPISVAHAVRGAGLAGDRRTGASAAQPLIAVGQLVPEPADRPSSQRAPRPCGAVDHGPALCTRFARKRAISVVLASALNVRDSAALPSVHPVKR